MVKALVAFVVGTVFSFFQVEREPPEADATGVPLVVIVVVLILLYFLPALIARKKPNAGSVMVINFFLGWTLVGWVVALAMAVRDPQPQVVIQQAPSPPKATMGQVCPFCAEDIKLAAIVCKHCGRDLPEADT